MEIRESLGRQLDKLRLSTGLSERKLAAACGIDHSTINSYVNATRWPSSKNLEVLLDYFDAELQVVERKNKGDPVSRITEALEEIGADRKLVDCIMYMLEPLMEKGSGENRRQRKDQGRAATG